MFDKDSEILAVGIGSAGSRIVSQLTEESVLIDRFVFVSCDKEDLKHEIGKNILVKSFVDQKLTPSMVRGLASKSMNQLRETISGAKVVFVVSGLGGATGSGLAPLIAEVATEMGAMVVGVAVMPFDYEKKLKFYAGISLRRLRQASGGVIVVDNDVLLNASPDDSTLTNIYQSANEQVARSLGALLSKAAATSVPVGLNKVLATVSQEGYSLLGISGSSSADKTEEALAGAVVSLEKLAEAKQASRAIVVLRGDNTLSASDIGVAVKRMGSMMNNDAVDIEYGVSYSGSPQLQVSLLASGFTSTKYDEFDPLAKILAGRVMDSESDSFLPEGLEGLSSFD